MKFLKNKSFIFGSLTLFGIFGYNSYSHQTQQPSQLTLNNTSAAYKITDSNPLTNFYKLKSREDHLKEITQENQIFDLIIIGGGCNGAGVFLEGASRGLKCVLLEANDFSAGTSSKSTKLIHGGIRYLEQVFELSLSGGRVEKWNLVKEALRERSHFIQNAYYMNKILPIVIPSESFLWSSYYYAGCIVYHMIYQIYKDKNSISFPLPVWIGNQQLRNAFPYLDSKYKYGIMYYDGSFDDSRMNLDILLTGTIDNYCKNNNFKGGNILNYADVVALNKNDNGRLNGVVFKDKNSGKEHYLKGKCVINCAGNFADNIRQMDDAQSCKRVISVGGTHIVMPQKYINKKWGLLLPETEDGRVVFILPWLNHSLVGTTEKTFPQPTISPVPSYEEVSFLIKQIQVLYTKLPADVISQDIKSQWCGLRPLILDSNQIEISNQQQQVSQASSISTISSSQQQKQIDRKKIDTKKVARNHVIEISKNGLISLMGGKWTIYRLMGEDTINTVIDQLETNKLIEKGSISKESQTKGLKLLGEFNKEKDNFIPPPKNQYITAYGKELQEQYKFLEKPSWKYLIKRYGDRAFDVMRLTIQDPSLSEKLVENEPFLKAEIIYQIRNEMVYDPMDCICRRLRLSFIDRESMMAAIPKIMNIFASELKWDKQKKQQNQERVIKELGKMSF